MPQITKQDVVTFYWKGQIRYRCPLKWESGGDCEFDSHDIEKVREHMAKTAHTYTGKPNDIPKSQPYVPPADEPETAGEVKFRE